MDQSKSFLSALKDRHLFRVAAAYLGAGWFVVEVAKNLSEIFGAPHWVPGAVFAVLALVFPIALAVSWIYEATPEQSRASGRRLDRAIAVVLALVIVVLLLDRYVPGVPFASGFDLRSNPLALYGAGVAVGLGALVGGTLAWRRRGRGIAKVSMESALPFAAPSTQNLEFTGPRIAVLPFANVSGEESQNYFSDGITENIIAGLSRFRDLFVISSHSIFTYKNKPLKSQDISRELGVTHLLQGSIQKFGERIRITAQLVDGASGSTLWAERYDRDLQDVFAVQDEVTELIIGTLASTHGGRLQKAWQGRASGSGTRNLQALDHFLRGVELLNHFNKEDTERGRLELQKAAQLDPKYAKPLAKISWSHMMDAYLGWSSDPPTSWATALEFAKRALERDDSEAWSHYALGGYYMYKRQHDHAIAEFQRALDLNPNEADIVNDFGLCLSYAGEANEGIKLAQKAMRLNPHFPEFYTMQLGQISFDARLYEQAISALESLRGEDTVLACLYLAASHAAMGHIQAAAHAIKRALLIEPGANLSRWISSELAPYKTTEDLEHLRKNLHAAGLPE